MRLFEVNDRGSAAAQCGKARPFRHSSFFVGEAVPRLGGGASLFFGPRVGKAKPYRTGRRQSRKIIVSCIGLLLFLSLTDWSSIVHSRSLHLQEGLEMPVQERSRIRA